MKLVNNLKFLTLCIVVSITSSCSDDISVDDTELLDYQEKVNSGHVKTVWRIGRKSRNCFRIGICKLDKVEVKIERVKITVYEDKSIGTYLIKEDNQTIRLEVDKDYMQKIRDEFGGDFLKLEEDFVLDDDDCDKLEISKGFTFKAGTYDFVESNVDPDVFYVRLTNN
ncbi:hypothetical protein CAP47_06185 [Psychroflexus sp. S27]|uniref:hypothetical protein n=1 Tax=Psychroflexus sp. S27 TaxID=1982757 RepID=UPI000C29AEFB|nr:hypothetical protein [Psychroflexus sp. S27]PJX23293.1 hypothetical protein CAP47_06185 [Psychroflexus sp. S27]